MTAKVIELRPGTTHRVPAPVSRWQQRKDWLLDVLWGTVSQRLAESPIVIVRRSKMIQREVTAFDLGREIERRHV